MTSRPCAPASSPRISRTYARLVALRSTLVDGALLREPLGRVPGERVPVPDEHLPLPKTVAEGGRHDVELVVEVLAPGGLEHLQAIPNGETRRHHEHVLRETAVLRLGDLVQDLPCHDERHDD